MSLMDEPLEAIVTFVTWTGQVIAYFRAYRQKGERDFTKTKPTLKNGWCEPKYRYWALEGYVHNGQHGDFDEEILRSARRATPEEYGPLKKELEDNGGILPVLETAPVEIVPVEAEIAEGTDVEPAPEMEVTVEESSEEADSTEPADAE